MTTKLKIDLIQGMLEVEGSETFVKAIYNDFKAYFIGEEATEDLLKPKRSRRTRKTKVAAKTPTPQPEPKVSPPAQAPQVEVPVSEPVPESPEPVPVEPVPKPEASAPKPTYTLLKDLDLSAADGRPSLVEFMDSKFPITNEERNLVFLHYLQHSLKIKSITIDHIYTCYKAAKIRVPLNIEQSLEATANQRGWIKIAKNGKLSVTSDGKLYVEKQLPKKTKSSKSLTPTHNE